LGFDELRPFTAANFLYGFGDGGMNYARVDTVDLLRWNLVGGGQIRQWISRHGG
jgi:hypothetical protein